MIVINPWIAYKRIPSLFTGDSEIDNCTTKAVLYTVVLTIIYMCITMFVILNFDKISNMYYKTLMVMGGSVTYILSLIFVINKCYK